MTFMIKAVTALLLTQSAYSLENMGDLEERLIAGNAAFKAQQQTVQSKEFLYSARVSRFLPSLSLVGGWQQNKTDDLSSVEKGTVAYAEGKWNLFNGFRDSALAGKLGAELERAKLELAQVKRDVHLRLTETVAGMIYLHKLNEILNEEQEVIKIQKAMAAKKVASGLTGPVDNLEFELRENEIEVERSEVGRQHRESHLKLIEFFGVDIADADLEKIEFSSKAVLADIDSKLDLDKNVNYKIAEVERLIQENEKNQVRSNLLPNLEAFYTVGRLTPSETDAYRYNESKYGIMLSWPIFSGFGDYNELRAGRSQLAATEAKKSQTEREVKSAFDVVRERIRSQGALYEVNERKIANSKKYFELTLQEYRRGIKNSPDLVTATERLFAARKKRYEILKDLEHSRALLQNLQ